MEIAELQTLAGASIIVVILTEVLKRTLALSEGQVTRFGPLIAIVLGIATTVGAAVALATDIPAAVLTGLLAGASASGVYSFTKMAR